MDTLETKICDYVESHSERLFGHIRELVRRDSQNTPPVGREAEAQQYLASLLNDCGWQAELYELDDVPGLRQHELFFGGREYAGRPNLGARRKGEGGGRSLILSGHADTVPRGTQPWTRDAFGGEIEGNRLYGRGSNDMKAGLAINAFAAEAVERLGIRLRGDLIFESVVDEEFGGVNGTLAGRLHGYVADGAIISEPSFLRICPGQRGGRVVHITLSASGGILTEGRYPAGVIDQLTYLLNSVREFAQERRRAAPVHPLYAAAVDPVPVSVTKIITAPWGTGEPITTPEECRIELYWQAMPGETKSVIDAGFAAWFDGMIAAAPQLFPRRPVVESPIRFLPGSAIAADHPLVTGLAACGAEVLGAAPPVAGIEGPCDMYVFHEFGIPAALWGPRGGNTHAADEYVELDTVIAAAKTLLMFVTRWCGV
jgi:acetylornithine deacetylase